MKYEKYNKGKNDLFSGIVLGGFAIAYLIGAAMIKIPKMLSASLLNASSVPKLWGVLLLILGIVLIVRGLHVMKAEKAAGNAPEKKTASDAAKGFWADNRAVVEMFVVLLVYIALIQPVGFLISTFLFLFAEFNILTYKEDRKLGFSVVFALVCAVGTLIGTIFGAIPGLTATMAVTICLPMTFAMSDSRAIALLMALYIGGISGGLVSSILLNIPGTPASMVTAFDGAPMARKGEGAKALGTGIFFSFLGTIFGLIALIIIAPYLAAVAIKFGAFEYCALSIFSLSLVISLAGKDMVKGLAAALLGVMFSTFGISTFDSIVRYDFGSVNMQSGFQQLVVLIGLYAIPEVVGVAQKVVKPKVIMQQNTTVDKIHGLGFTWQEFKSQIGNFFIAAAIGTGIGILPGIGGGTAGIMSYTTIKNRSKTPEKFGTGIMDGVVASETANNAAIGGAMIPLLTLGIPGDGITAILLGSLIIHGIAPGPLIFEKSGALMYSIYLIIGLSSLFMMIFMLFGIKGFVKILSAPQGLLMPIILCMCCVGAFGCSNRMFDVWCLLIFGLIAVVIRAMELPIMPVAIGFILGPIFEKNLRRAESFMTSGPAELLHHPIALVILVITVVMIIFSLRSNKRAAEREAAVAAAEEQE